MARCSRSGNEREVGIMGDPLSEAIRNVQAAYAACGNSRIKTMLDAARYQLQRADEAWKQLATREQLPAFVVAMRLFTEGWRLFNWDAILNDTIEETILFHKAEQRGYWSDGTNLCTDEAFDHLGIDRRDPLRESIAQYLCELTLEVEGGDAYCYHYEE
jgi:hypothetical protein